jgi:hypothetical protein
MSGYRRLGAGALCVLATTLSMVTATPARATGSTAGATGSTAGATGSAAGAADCRSVLRFDDEDFARRPRIDNRFLPLRPGTETMLSGTVLDDEGRRHPHTIVATVTGVTKRLDGIRALVVFERDYEDGALQESELAFVAQDEHGAVWNVGEYPEEYEDGKLVGADNTWIAGIASSRAGLAMLGHPRVGTPAYLQGLATSVDFRDCARVIRTGARVCVPIRCFDNVLITDEWSPLDAEGGHQLKYYAPGVGSIRVGAVGGASQEVLALTRYTRLSRTALAKVNAAVLRQDRRGYHVNKHVYAHTQHAVLGLTGRC